MEETFKELSKILNIKPTQVQNYTYQFQGQPEEYLEKFIVAYALKQGFAEKKEIVNKFINYMNDQRYCKLMQSFFNETEGIKILSCSQCKSYSFDHQSRAYCLYGKAVSGLKRKTKEPQNQRSFITNQIENTIFQMLQDGNYPLAKYQSKDSDDVLLNFSNEDTQFDPIFLSNEVFSPFIPQPYALILILPLAIPKADHLFNYVKGSLLHIYIDEINLLSKLIFKETFYKNSVVKGIYFIDQGEVESTGGRIVARGWVTNGKCKSEGFGWKFKVLPFMKSILKNEHIWKQFINDLTLNKQYPLRISYVLGLDDEMQMYEMPQRGRRGIKLPRIGNSSLDYGKLTEIEKMKHYDQRINDICDYKEKLLQKKENKSSAKNSQRLVDSYDERVHRKMMKQQPSNSRPMLRYPSSSLTSSSQNILIMSVLKKLESLAEPKNPLNDEYQREKREKIRISPAQLFEKSRVMKKKRYNS